MGLEVFNGLTRPIDHTSRRRLQRRHDVHLGHASVVVLVEVCKVLVSYKLKSHSMVRDGHRELSAQ